MEPMKEQIRQIRNRFVSENMDESKKSHVLECAFWKLYDALDNALYIADTFDYIKEREGGKPHE